MIAQVQVYATLQCLEVGSSQEWIYISTNGQKLM